MVTDNEIQINYSMRMNRADFTLKRTEEVLLVHSSMHSVNEEITSLKLTFSLRQDKKLEQY